jgi:D-alanine-D-alanine ligase
MKQIAILMGGYSEEAVISMKSAEVVFENLDRKLYNPYKVLINRDKWVVLVDNQQYEIDKNDFSAQIKGEKLKFDGIFNTIHGIPGENGFLQAYFELINIPFTGADFFTSALTFNKKACCDLLKINGICTANHFLIRKNGVLLLEEITKKARFPLFVKPNQSGSSFGASKVSKEEELPKAIENAFLQGDEVLIETFLQGREFSISVVKFKGEIRVLPITEIISENDFFDYEAKYQGKSKEITPANLSEDIKEKLNNLAKKIYKVLNLKGFSRMDFIVVENEPYFLEVNTNPGLSKESILPTQALEAEISLKELFNDYISSIFV